MNQYILIIFYQRETLPAVRNDEDALLHLKGEFILEPDR